MADKELLDNLVERARAGSRPAFSKLVRLMMNRVTSITYRLVGDRDTALDLAQDTFVSAWENLPTYRGEAAFTSWIYRIASNKAINYLNAPAQKRRETVVEESVSEDVSPERQLHQRELAARIKEFMHTLPPQQRVIFELRFYGEMSFEEISRTTGRALGTVKTNYREAVKKLRAFATKEGLR